MVFQSLFQQCGRTGLHQRGKKNTGDKVSSFLRKAIFLMFIQSLLYESPVYCVGARSYRSLRKHEESYHMHLLASKKDNRAAVDRAHCSCTYGCCNHAFALLILLKGCSSSKIKDIPSDSTCNSKPQTWHIPRSQSCFPLLVMATYYDRAVTNMNGGRKRYPITFKQYDATSNFARKALPDLLFKNKLQC